MPKDKLTPIRDVIKEWKLPKIVLAEKMKMPYPTFKNKINADPKYNLTKEETDKLASVLRELQQDLKKALK